MKAHITDNEAAPETSREHKRINLVKAAGWKHEPRSLSICGIAIADSFPWVKPDGKRTWDGEIPDFFGDLNACREFELAHIAGKFDVEFRCHLAQKAADFDEANGMCLDTDAYIAACIYASAEEHAEAMGKTLGLW